MDKPPILYHASPNNNIEIFEPRVGKRPHNFNEGPVLFATDDFAFATHFLVNTKSTWTADGVLNGVHYYIACDQKRFMASDIGGTIYTLPSESFWPLKHLEWYSKSSVKPINKKYFPSGLQCMIQNKVQVYFVDLPTFQTIKNSNDHGLEILKNLISENSKIGTNAIVFS